MTNPTPSVSQWRPKGKVECPVTRQRCNVEESCRRAAQCITTLTKAPKKPDPP